MQIAHPHATGPRTPEGKQRSSLNAIRHGLFAESPLLPGEDAGPYEAFRLAFLEDLTPQGLIETQLAEAIAGLHWRLQRCKKIEQAILVAEDLPLAEQIDLLNRYSLYEGRLARRAAASLKQLRESQAERKALQQQEMDKAIQVAIQCRATNTKFIPAHFGFVFSAEEVRVLVNRHERLNPAKQTHSGGRR